MRLIFRNTGILEYISNLSGILKDEYLLNVYMVLLFGKAPKAEAKPWVNEIWYSEKKSRKLPFLSNIL